MLRMVSVDPVSCFELRTFNFSSFSIMLSTIHNSSCVYDYDFYIFVPISFRDFFFFIIKKLWKWTGWCWSMLLTPALVVCRGRWISEFEGRLGYIEKPCGAGERPWDPFFLWLYDFFFLSLVLCLICLWFVYVETALYPWIKSLF